MKNYIIASIFLLASPLSQSNEWIEVGRKDSNVDIDTSLIEERIWTYLEESTDVEFEVRELYKFQYKHINTNKLHINALCSPKKSGDTNVGTYPQPSNEELAREFYEVYDGGSCYFRVNYNIKSGEFSKLFVNGRA